MRCCISICHQGMQSRSSNLLMPMTSSRRIHLKRTRFQMELHSNATLHMLCQKLFLVLPQGLDQCDGIQILDPKKNIL